MGNAPSQDPSERARSRAIETELFQDKRAKRSELTIVILGAEGAGKSTLAKQLKMLYGNGYSDEERLAFKDLVVSNIYTNLRALLKGVEAGEFELQETTKEIMKREWINDPAEPMNADIAEDLKQLWADPVLKQVFDANQGDMEDSTPYFFDGGNLYRIRASDYVPTDEDILRVRVNTPGIDETVFELSGKTYRIIDVGGQKSARRKWIHSFEGVKAVIFCVSMSEYNQFLKEDPEVRCMHESISLFDEVLNAKWFTESSIVFFFNKDDLFREKIKKIDMKCMFDDYKGGNDYKAGREFLKKVFVDLVQHPEGQKREIFSHFTNATDPIGTKHVFQEMRAQILKQPVADACPGCEKDPE